MRTYLLVILMMWQQPAQRTSPPSIALDAREPSRCLKSDFLVDWAASNSARVTSASCAFSLTTLPLRAWPRYTEFLTRPLTPTFDQYGLPLELRTPCSSRNCAS